MPEDFCDECGLLKPIARAELMPRIVNGKRVGGVKEVKYCRQCSGVKQGIADAVAEMQPGMVDDTEQVRPLYDQVRESLGFPFTVQAASGTWRQFTKRPVTVWVRGPVTEAEDIQTLEGTMRASPGDFVIRGVNGEMYPCKPDIFHKTYEQAGVLKARKLPKTVADEIRYRRDMKYFVRGFLLSMVLFGLAVLFILHYLKFI